MEKLIEKMQNADGYIVLTLYKRGENTKVLIDHSETLGKDVVDKFLQKIATKVKKNNRK